MMTEGEWKKQTRPASHPFDITISDERGDCIAIMDSRGGMATTDEMDDNANVMAAAKVLLAACETALYEVDKTEVFLKLEAAIKKARGET